MSRDVHVPCSAVEVVSSLTGNSTNSTEGVSSVWQDSTTLRQVMACLQSYWFRLLFMSLLCVTASAITINNNLTGELCAHTVAHEGP